MRVLAAIGFVMAMARGAFASGFLLYEQSAEALAKGGALSASVRDASAAWFNPAALAFLGTHGAQVSTALLRPETSFSPADGGASVRSLNDTFFVPSVFAYARVADRVHAGLGLFAPFGIAVGWPDGWVGAQASLATNLRTIAINPNAAARITDRLSVGGGISLIRGDVNLAVGLPPEVGGRADLDGNAWGFGANLGLLLRLRPEVIHLAATYRSQSRLSFKGKADLAPAKPGFDDSYPDQWAKAAITLPDMVVIGAMFRPHARLELSFEINQVFWSAFDRLHIEFEHETMPLPDRVLERNSGNPLTVRGGLEWTWPLADGGARAALRAGALYDQSASPEETLAPSAPDGNRLGLGAGIGLARGRLRASMGYLLTHFFVAEAAPSRQTPDQPPRGTYRTRVHVLGFTVGLE